MANHSTLSPSSAERWINCPASVEMSSKFPDTKSPYAAEGTAAHKLSELKIRDSILNESIDAGEWEKVKTSEYYNADMEDYSDEYVEFVRSFVKAEDTTLLTETKVDLDFLAPDTFGTADCLVLSGNTLDVIDFKYGKNVQVLADNNPQLKLYALGALKLLDGLIYDIKNVRIHIAQPRMNNYSSDEFTKEELKEWLLKEVKPQAQKAVEGSIEIKAGHWCKFCKAKCVCREYGKRYDLDMVRKNPNELTNEEIAVRIEKLTGLEGYLKELQDYALVHILKGEIFPGYKAVAGRSNRTWTDQEKAFAVAEANGYDRSVLFVQKPLTLSQVEKMMGKKAFKELLGDYVEKPEGKPTLVSNKDPREALVPTDSAIEDFKDVFVHVDYNKNSAIYEFKDVQI